MSLSIGHGPAGYPEYKLGVNDVLYIPRRKRLRLTGDLAQVFQASAPVENDYPIPLHRFKEQSKDSALHYSIGKNGAKREIFQLFGESALAGRLLVGLTRSEPGNWTSWPPHEHSAILEEIYVFVDMPAPASGIQFVYDTHLNQASSAVVREGDIVLIPKGYHPNVAIPEYSLCFVWIMVAHREVLDRRYGNVNFDPGFVPEIASS